MDELIASSGVIRHIEILTIGGYNVWLLGRIHVVLHGLIEFTSVALDPSPNLGTVPAIIILRIGVCQKKLFDQSRTGHQQACDETPQSFKFVKTDVPSRMNRNDDVPYRSYGFPIPLGMSLSASEQVGRSHRAHGR